MKFNQLARGDVFSFTDSPTYRNVPWIKVGPRSYYSPVYHRQMARMNKPYGITIKKKNAVLKVGSASVTVTFIRHGKTPSI